MRDWGGRRVFHTSPIYVTTRRHFFGSRGIFNFDEVGETHEVIDADARARDRSRARQIGLASVAIGVAVAVAAVLLPL